MCEHELDVFVEAEIDLQVIRLDELPPLHILPKKCKIDVLDLDFTNQFTIFTKPKFQHHLMYPQLPSKITFPHRHYSFTGKELLIVCLTRIANSDPWHRLVPNDLCSGLSRESERYEW